MPVKIAEYIRKLRTMTPETEADARAARFARLAAIAAADRQAMIREHFPIDFGPVYTMPLITRGTHATK